MTFVDAYSFDPDEGPLTLEQLAIEAALERQDRDADREFVAEPFVPHARFL